MVIVLSPWAVRQESVAGAECGVPLTSSQLAIVIGPIYVAEAVKRGAPPSDVFSRSRVPIA